MHRNYTALYRTLVTSCSHNELYFLQRFSWLSYPNIWPDPCSKRRSLEVSGIACFYGHTLGNRYCTAYYGFMVMSDAPLFTATCELTGGCNRISGRRWQFQAFIENDQTFATCYEVILDGTSGDHMDHAHCSRVCSVSLWFDVHL